MPNVVDQSAWWPQQYLLGLVGYIYNKWLALKVWILSMSIGTQVCCYRLQSPNNFSPVWALDFNHI